MDLIDLVKCTTKHRSSKNCCGQETAICSETESNDYNESFIFTGWKNTVRNDQPVISTEPMSGQERNNDTSEVSYFNTWTTDRMSPAYQLSSELSYNVEDQINVNYYQEVSQFSQNEDFLCPRCGRRMQEPRLLPCLHPICSPCVFELVNKVPHTSGNKMWDDHSFNHNERCVLCDFQLPTNGSTIPPPHYPLQHRLVMNAVRCKLVNRVLCDVCSDEVLAVVQCSTCLRNFCSNCGRRHQEQITMELKPTRHPVKPLWEATRIRRTALCQTHPTHALRYYCIACQQVTCKECMWSSQHRGHASETAIGAGKRVAVYLTAALEKAQLLLTSLTTQYSHNTFYNNTFNRQQNVDLVPEYRYVKQIISRLL